MSEITRSNRLKGIVFIILSAFGFAVMSAFIKLSGDLPNIQKVFFRNLVAAIIALFLIIKHKGSFTGKKENRKVLIYRSLFGTTLTSKDGFIINNAPINATIIADICFIFIFSFNIKAQNTTTKNGLILFNIFASDKTKLSMA